MARIKRLEQYIVADDDHTFTDLERPTPSKLDIVHEDQRQMAPVEIITELNDVDRIWSMVLSDDQTVRSEAARTIARCLDQGICSNELSERIGKYANGNFFDFMIGYKEGSSQRILLRVALAYAQRRSVFSLRSEDVITLMGMPFPDIVLEIGLVYAKGNKFSGEQWQKLADKLSIDYIDDAVMADPKMLFTVLGILKVCAEHDACCKYSLVSMLNYLLDGSDLTEEVLQAIEAYLVKGQCCYPMLNVCMGAIKTGTAFENRCLKVVLDHANNKFVERSNIQIIKRYLDAEVEGRMLALQILEAYASFNYVDRRLVCKMSALLDSSYPKEVAAAAKALAAYGLRKGGSAKALAKVVGRTGGTEEVTASYARMIWSYYHSDLFNLDAFDFFTRNFDPIQRESSRDIAKALHHYTSRGLLRKDMIPMLVDMTYLNDVETQKAATIALYNSVQNGMMSEDLLDSMVYLLGSKDKELVGWAVAVIARCSERGLFFWYVVDKLIPFLKSEDGETRDFTAWAILKYGMANYVSAKAMGPAIERMLDTKEMNSVRKDCAGILKVYHSHGFVNIELLRSIRKMEGQGETLVGMSCELVRDYARSGLFSPEAETFLRIQLRHSEDRVKEAAKEALKIYGSRSAR